MCIRDSLSTQAFKYFVVVDYYKNHSDLLSYTSLPSIFLLKEVFSIICDMQKLKVMNSEFWLTIKLVKDINTLSIIEKSTWQLL